MSDTAALIVVAAVLIVGIPTALWVLVYFGLYWFQLYTDNLKDLDINWEDEDE